MLRKTLAVCAAASALCFVPLNAADWPNWRGPNASGVSPETSLPLRWSPSSGVRWSKAIPGYGASSPVVAGDRVYLTTQTEDKAFRAIALDASTGETIWNASLAVGDRKTHQLHNMATPTPVAAGGRVWVLSGMGEVACLDAKGQALWRRNLQEDHGEYAIMWGMGTSPLLVERTLVVACMQAGPSYVIGLDANTGALRWKQDRNLGPETEARDSYSSPALLQTADGPLVVLSGADHVNAYDPKTGRQSWIIGGLEVSHPYGRTIAGPTASGTTVVTAASGFQNRGRVMAFSVKDGSVAHKWTQSRYSPDCPSPVIMDGLVFLVRDDGIASCLDLQTGEAHWQERLFAANVKISPVAGDGKVYFFNGQGSCAVVAAKKDFVVLQENSLGDEAIASPAISDGVLYFRSKGRLYAIEG